MQDTHNSITLTAEQANTLNTTGRLEGFKELCEFDSPRPPSKVEPYCHDPRKWVVAVPAEPMGHFEFERPDGSRYKDTVILGPNTQTVITPTRAVGQVYAVKSVAFPFRLCDIREQHAKIATEPTLSIHEGKLVWTYDLVKE